MFYRMIIWTQGSKKWICFSVIQFSLPWRTFTDDLNRIDSRHILYIITSFLNIPRTFVTYLKLR